MEKCLVFEVRGDWAHFRKIYTTSSPLSYSIPPRTTTAGLIAAVIGLDKTQYYDYFTKDRASIAVRIINPIRKFRIGLNFINTKTAKMFAQIRERTQVKQELVKKPHYRIYFYHTDQEMYQNLQGFLERGQSFYTPYLGLSEYLAHIEYIGELAIREVNGGVEVPIHSVLPLHDKFPINFDQDDPDQRGEYFKETMPNDFERGNQRVVNEFAKVLFERKGKAIKCTPNKYWQVGNGENIIFL
ncbi:type I-B CRISPR-associated protein Cas5b [Bacillota bacterium LX-D]|nr:type I-B CRISPR-associated protein Cas5b [Bacillota bacterium LX-D]